MAYQEGPYREGRRAFLGRGWRLGVVAVVTPTALAAACDTRPERRGDPEVNTPQARLFLEEQTRLVSDSQPRTLTEALADPGFRTTTAGRSLSTLYAESPNARLLTVRQVQLDGSKLDPKGDLSFWEYFLDHQASVDGPAYDQYALTEQPLADHTGLNFLLIPRNPNKFARVYTDEALMESIIHQTNGTERSHWVNIAQDLRWEQRHRSIALAPNK